MWTDCLPDTVFENFKLKASWSYFTKKTQKKMKPGLWHQSRFLLPEAEITAKIDSEKVWVINYE